MDLQQAITKTVHQAVFEALSDWHRRKDHKDPPNQYITRKQVSELLNIGVSTVDYWSRIGRLTKIKIGGSVRYDKAEIESNLNNLKKYKR